MFTLFHRNVKELGRIAVVRVIPLCFREKLPVLRTKKIPAPLHGVEASPTSVSGLASLRAAFSNAVCSTRMRPLDKKNTTGQKKKTSGGENQN